MVTFFKNFTLKSKFLKRQEKKIPKASRLEEKTLRHTCVPAALIEPYRVYKKLPEPIHEIVVVAGCKPNNKNQIISI